MKTELENVAGAPQGGGLESSSSLQGEPKPVRRERRRTVRTSTLAFPSQSAQWGVTGFCDKPMRTGPGVTELVTDPGQDLACSGQTPLECGRYVAIAGNIGSGKSSLVEFLSRRYGVEPYGEPNDDNPYLEDFYGNMNRWALHSQLFFLTHKLRIHREIEATTKPALLDRTIYEDAEIFALNCHKMGLLDNRDFMTYWHLYQNLAYTIRPPALMIYLRCPVRNIRRRIKLRGREMEQQVPTEYLQRLNKLYEQWYERYDLSPVLVLNTGKLDYVTDLVDCYDLIQALDGHMGAV